MLPKREKKFITIFDKVIKLSMNRAVIYRYSKCWDGLCFRLRYERYLVGIEEEVVVELILYV